jgi:hypothetical protein
MPKHTVKLFVVRNIQICVERKSCSLFSSYEQACTSQKVKAMKIKCQFYLNSWKVNAFFSWFRLQYDFSCIQLDVQWKLFYTEGLISKIFYIRTKKTPVEASAKLIFDSNYCTVMDMLEIRSTRFCCANWIAQNWLYINIKDVSPCFSTSVPFALTTEARFKPVGSDKAII